MRGILQRAAWKFALLNGLGVYLPQASTAAQIAEHTDFVRDSRPIRDKRPTTATDELPDLTITTDGLEDALDWEHFRERRVLEIGPKYGEHSVWLDRRLAPSELVLLDLPEDAWRHDPWRDRLTCPHRFVYADLRDAPELERLESFDLVLFLGVLYHSIHHIPMLQALNRATRLGSTMLLESTVDSRPDPLARLDWKETGKAKAVPTLSGLRALLAWTGWRKVVQLTDYRPGSTEMLLVCEKTDELDPHTGLAPIVHPQRARRARTAD